MWNPCWQRRDAKPPATHGRPSPTIRNSAGPNRSGLERSRQRLRTVGAVDGSTITSQRLVGVRARRLASCHRRYPPSCTFKWLWAVARARLLLWMSWALSAGQRAACKATLEGMIQPWGRQRNHQVGCGGWPKWNLGGLRGDSVLGLRPLRVFPRRSATHTALSLTHTQPDTHDRPGC